MSTNPKTIIISGKQGAGKETQINFLKKKLSGETILYESGESLRKFAKRPNSKLANHVGALLSQGTFIPTWLAMNLCIDSLVKLKGTENLILDGMPRSIDQAIILDEAFAMMNRTDVKYVLIDITNEEAIKRISLRYYCPKCDKVFSMKNEAAKICPNCQGALIRRDDDKPDALNKRLQWSSLNLKAIVDFYQKKEMYIHVQGNQSVEAVSKEIFEKLVLK
jgi:adenylate kinase